jgi:hypothetical protein
VRTTVTIEPDVYALLRTVMKERQVSFKEALNAAVRAGLTGNQRRCPFVQQSFSMGHAQTFPWDMAPEAASAIEDEELSRKLSLRK